jgi:hypothetical protein
MGENREWVEQKEDNYERAANRSCVSNEVFHSRVWKHFMVAVIAFRV